MSVLAFPRKARASQAAASATAAEHAAPLSIRGRVGWALPFLVASGLLGPSLVWVCRDRAVWPWDPAWYGEVAVQLYYTLRHEPAKWVSAMTHAIGAKAPGVAWWAQLFVPLRRVFGSIDAAFLVSVLATQAMTLLLVWKTGRTLNGGRGVLVPLAGCLLVGSAPLFVGLSHQFFPEPLQALAVAWFFYLALVSRNWPRLRILTHLLGATSVAMLAKSSSPLYCFLPGLIAACNLLPHRFRSSDPPRQHRLWAALTFTASAGLFVLTVWWYRANFGPMMTHVYNSSVGEMALMYGKRAQFREKFAFWTSAMGHALFQPRGFTAALTLVGVQLARAAVRVVREKRLRAGDLLALAALVHVLAMLTAFCLSINEESRYLLPGLPALAVLFLWALSGLRTRLIALGFVALLAYQWVGVQSVAHGFAANTSGNYWLLPVDPDPAHDEGLKQLIQFTTREDRLVNRYNVVGIELTWFNANSLNYYAEKDRVSSHKRAYYTGLGYAENDVDKAYRRMEDLNAVSFISLAASRQPSPPHPLNAVSLPVLERVSRDDAFVQVPYASEAGVVIFQRNARP